MRFSSDDYTRLELFLKMSPTARVALAAGDHMRTWRADGRWYGRVVFSLKKHTQYELCVSNATLALGYLCQAQAMTPVRFLPDEECPCSREAYHFTPYRGWMNDPNGFCYFQGQWHLFFQYNPYRLEPGELHWGHAFSRDLLHWAHLPVLLEPQRELQLDPSLKGGAYSGGALAEGDRITLFFTRHIAHRVSRLPFSERQVAIETNDMARFSKEKPLMLTQPHGYTPDFRDPQVSRDADGYRMLLGSAREDGTPAVLCYRSDDLATWRFAGELLADKVCGAQAMECPDCYMLDGAWVLTVSLMRYRDAQGRGYGMYWYTGQYKNNQFHWERKGLMDFGADLYAVQSATDGARRVAIGWVSDFSGALADCERGYRGRMSLPRELFLQNGRLCMRPAREVYDLLGEAVDAASLAPSLSGGYYIRIRLRAAVDFSLLLALGRQNASLSLLCENAVTMLKIKNAVGETITFASDETNVTQVEIFVDRYVTEVFLNEGRSYATKVFPAEKWPLESVFASPEAVESFGIRRVR